jgi:hypothetical protein
VRQAIEIFESMISSRHLDLEARNLKARNASFYTIGSSGHEGNAAVAAALRPDDMAFLHYRSGGFFVERARQVPGTTPLMDVLLGIVASTDEPIAGGRHKVFGSKALQIPPQTVDDRVATPEGGRRRVLPRPRDVPRAADARVRGRDRRRELRRRERESFHRVRCLQRGRVGAASAHAVSDPLPVRGQRHRHQRAHPDQLDPRAVRGASAPAVLCGGRARHRGHVRRGRRGGAVRARTARARVPPPLAGPAARSRGLGRRAELPQRRRDRSDRVEGPARPHGDVDGGRGDSRAGGDRGALRGRTGARRTDRCGSHATSRGRRRAQR